MRPEFAQVSAHAFGISRQVEGPERANFAVAGEAGVGLDADDGAVENGDGLAAASLVGDFVEWEFNAVGQEAGDFHGVLRINAGQESIAIANATEGITDWHRCFITIRARGLFL